MYDGTNFNYYYQEYPSQTKWYMTNRYGSWYVKDCSYDDSRQWNSWHNTYNMPMYFWNEVNKESDKIEKINSLQAENDLLRKTVKAMLEINYTE